MGEINVLGRDKMKKNPSTVGGKDPGGVKQFYRAVSIARMLDVSVGQIWHWAKTGVLPPGRKLSPQITVWDAEVIDEFIKQKKAV
jgi:predicted DNA-binding transcriptional regulator AlpA